MARGRGRISVGELPAFLWRRAWRWRILRCVAGIGLAACFFVPAAPGCNEDIVPVREVADAMRDGSAEGLINAFFVVFVAYLIGFLIAVNTVLQLRRCDRLAQIGERVALGIGCATAFGVVVLSVYEVHQSGGASAGELIFGGMMLGLLPVCAGAGLLASLRLGPYRYLFGCFVAAVCEVLWFGYWSAALGADMVRSGLKLFLVYPGIVFGMAFSLLLLIGVVAEGRVLSGRSLGATVWLLLTCRLRITWEAGPLCPGCGYSLMGLELLRCPECGRPFTWDEVGGRSAGAGDTNRGANEVTDGVSAARD